jgi:CDP-glycerol glycerophosphotransferase (TagB/SpsB family)
MPPSPLKRAAERLALGVFPGAARFRLLRAIGSQLGLAGAEIGLVTVVVVAEPGDRTEESLASVQAQTHALLEVLVCPVGSAEVELPDDPRFRVRPPCATSYDAVNAGIEAAAGDHVILLRGCDLLLPNAAAVLGGSLAASGSDLASGVLTQAGEPETWLSRSQADAHAEPGRGLPVSARHAADLGLANKAFSRAFARLLRLGETDTWLCSPTLAHLLPEATLDVLDRPVAQWSHGRGHRPFGARPSPLPDLERWLLLRDLAAGAAAGSELADGCRQHWFDVVLPRFLTDAERADQATWIRLVELVHAPPGVELRASSRSLLWLAAQGRRGEVEALAAELEVLGDDVRTELTDLGLVARWRSVSVPDEICVLSPAETRLLTQVVRLVPGPPQALDLFARIEGLDLRRHGAEATAEADGRVLKVVIGADPAANRWAGSRFQSAADGALRVEVPDGVEHVRLRLRAGVVERFATVEVPPPPVEATSSPAVQAVWLDGDLLVVQLDEPADGLRLCGPGIDLQGEARRDGTVVFDTRRDLYGRAVWLPTARYRLERRGGLTAAPAWRERLPVEVVGERHRLRVLPDGTSPGELHLGPPRDDDELGAWGQEQLRASYAADPRPTDPGLWYFESFAGRSATDTPLALFRELRRRQPEVRPVWGIVDHGHWAPEDSRPVVIGSREWYDVLATARVLVTNTELEEWYRRRPDQLVVQCFHGYPSKAMGESQWRARELPPRLVAVMRRRSVDTWDLISTPTPEATALYRQEYAYDGPAAEHGYPRNDALRGPDADRLRTETRRRLGIRDDQTAVLYAPTWRDHLATRPRAATMSEFLDLDAAASALGPSHVLLLRGHRFHTPSTSRPGVVDVTDHPEINELVLASDAAVLDYSSLRFDYALTGRPMVFLAPDLDDYTSGVRGFLLPFAETAPGPLVSTTAEVVDLVRDVRALTAAWGDRVRAFDATVNPWQDGRAAERFMDELTTLFGGRLGPDHG